jgi:hypothetical protein
MPVVRSFRLPRHLAILIVDEEAAGLAAAGGGHIGGVTSATAKADLI